MAEPQTASEAAQAFLLKWQRTESPFFKPREFETLLRDYPELIVGRISGKSGKETTLLMDMLHTGNADLAPALLERMAEAMTPDELHRALTHTDTKNRNTASLAFQLGNQTLFKALYDADIRPADKKRSTYHHLLSIKIYSKAAYDTLANTFGKEDADQATRYYFYYRMNELNLAKTVFTNSDHYRNVLAELQAEANANNQNYNYAYAGTQQIIDRDRHCMLGEIRRAMKDLPHLFRESEDYTRNALDLFLKHSCQEALMRAQVDVTKKRVDTLTKSDSFDTFRECNTLLSDLTKAGYLRSSYINYSHPSDNIGAVYSTCGILRDYYDDPQVKPILHHHMSAVLNKGTDEHKRALVMYFGAIPEFAEMIREKDPKLLEHHKWTAPKPKTIDGGMGAILRDMGVVVAAGTGAPPAVALLRLPEKIR